MTENNRPEYIDIHAHINFPDFDKDRDEVLQRAQDSNTWMINVGTNLDTSREVVDLVNEGVYAIVGMHPNETGETFYINEYRELLKNPRVVGIGECGLDYFRLPDDTQIAMDLIEEQKKGFRAQIELAIEFDKPLMIHARDSYDDILSILDEYLNKPDVKLRGNVHFFAGSTEVARAFLDRGFTLSFTGVITFAKEYAEVVKMTPLESIMSETDCPFVSPAPFRGARSEPIRVKEVAAKIAEIKGLDIEIVKKALVDNAFRVFRLG